MRPIGLDQMSPEQRAVYEEALTGRRGAIPGPLMIWLESPAMAAQAQRLGESIRFDLHLPPRLVALAALMVAAHWKAAYVWEKQTAKAKAEGIPTDAIAAIAAGRPPGLTNPNDIMTHDVVRALLDQRRLDDACFQDAVGEFGSAGLVELVAAVGYYNLVAMTAAVFELPSEPVAA